MTYDDRAYAAHGNFPGPGTLVLKICSANGQYGYRNSQVYLLLGHARSHVMSKTPYDIGSCFRSPVSMNDSEEVWETAG